MTCTNAPRFPRNFVHRIRFLLLILWMLFPRPGRGEVGGAPTATGLIGPTAADTAWMKRHGINIREIRFNALGVQRLNASARLFRRHSTPSPEPVATGDEIEGIAGATHGARAFMARAPSLPVLPPSVDNSQLDAFPPIGNQGAQGSCACFSSTYYQMTHMVALANSIDAKHGGDATHFSPAFTYNLINRGVDAGSWYGQAHQVMLKHGSPTWADFPYSQWNFRKWPTDALIWRNAINYRMDRTGTVNGLSTDGGLNTLKGLLTNGYVLVFGTFAPFTNVTAQDGSRGWNRGTVSNNPATTTDDAYVGQFGGTFILPRGGLHAMTIVGYNDDIWFDINSNGIMEEKEKGALKIANSWGPSWANRGFVWLAYDALRPVSAVPGWNPPGNKVGLYQDSALWITARRAYQPRLVGKFTLNHLKRQQLSLTLGFSTTSDAAPTSTWDPTAIRHQGGNYAFDGTTTAQDGSFAMDFTDLAPAATTDGRWYLGVQDTLTGDAATVKAFELYRTETNSDHLVASATNLPRTVDRQTIQVALDYRSGTSNQDPVADLRTDVRSGPIPLTVNFDGMASRDPDGSIVSYAWNFGDGSTGSGATASHSYNQVGHFTATLVVTDAAGATASRSILISPTQNVENRAPVAILSSSPRVGKVPFTVEFSGGKSRDEDGRIVSYAWSFGDGIDDAGKAVRHTYTTAGTFTATLIVTDDRGARASTTTTLRAIDPAIAAPGNLTASVSDHTVTLRWIDNSNNESVFEIERGVRSGSTTSYSRIGMVDGNLTRFIRKSESSGEYVYRVRARNLLINTNSTYSNEVVVRIP